MKLDQASLNNRAEDRAQLRRKKSRVLVVQEPQQVPLYLVSKLWIEVFEKRLAFVR